MPDFPPCDDVCGALEEHVRRFFAGRTIEVITWPAGLIQEQNPRFRVLRVEPTSSADVRPTTSRSGWAATDGDYGLEFVVCTPSADDRAVEVLAMTVFYNRGGQFGLGHTLPVGEPWLPGSGCDHLLVSLPTRSARNYRQATSAIATSSSCGFYRLPRRRQRPLGS